jgi:hypothetical protein
MISQTSWSTIVAFLGIKRTKTAVIFPKMETTGGQHKTPKRARREYWRGRIVSYGVTRAPIAVAVASERSVVFVVITVVTPIASPTRAAVKTTQSTVTAPDSFRLNREKNLFTGTPTRLK